MKRCIFSLLFACLMVFSFGFSFEKHQNDTTYASTDYSNFYTQVAEVCKTSDHDYIYIEKKQNINSLEKSLNIEGEYINLIDKNESETLTRDEIKEFCEDNDYLLIEEENYFKARNKFSLKRLIVLGKVKNSYNAVKIISGYRDFNILCYASIQETKIAYENLKKDSKVVVDTIISDENLNIQSYNNYDYSKYMSWGAKAIDLGVYNEYLQNNSTNAEIAVAVLDSGINTSHEIFKDRILKDSNGNYVGYSFYNTIYTYSGYDFEDDRGHGTHVSGTICELTPSNVKILPIKVLNNEGKGFFSAWISALSLLEDDELNKYQIACVNMSLGGEVTNESLLISFKEQFENIFKSLKSRNTLTVVSASNFSSDTSTFGPAFCDEAIVVSALKRSGENYVFDSSYSNYGKTVDISAPGTSIRSAYIGTVNGVCTNKYTYCTGTSMASPHVSAAVALFTLDKNYYKNGKANYTTSDIEERLYFSSIDMGESGKDIYYGYGMLNLKNHLFEISYSVEDNEVTYDGNHHNIKVAVSTPETYTITYGLSENIYDITDISNNNNFKDYTNGQMAVYFKISANRYKDAYGVGYLTINQKELSVNVNDQVCIYGEVNIDQSKYSLDSGGLVAGDNINISLTTTATNISPVGNYSINLSYDNNNYKLNYTSGKLTIKKRNLSIKLLDQTTEYGELKLIDNAYTITSGKIVNNDDLGLVLFSNATKTSDAGKYSISLKSYTNTNYNITASVAQLTISQRPISIILNNQSSTYGNEIEINNDDFVISEGELIEGTNLGLTLKTQANPNMVGKYSLQVDDYSNKNYILTATEAIYEVEKRAIQVIVEDQTFKYGDEIFLDSSKYAVPENAIIDGDNLNFNLFTTASADSEVGDYLISLTYSNENYIVEVVQGTLKVLPRTIIITFSKTTYNYGVEVSLDNVSYTIAGDTIINNDQVDIDLSTSANTFSNVGEYEIKATSSNKNYQLQLVNNFIVINPIEILASFSQTGVYGNAINLDQSNFLLQSETINNDVVSFTLTTNASNKSGVGIYEVYAECSNNNYQVIFTKNEFIITPRPVKIQVHNQTGVYGNNVNLVQSGYRINSGLIVGDNLGVSLETNATKTSNVGKYQITASISNENYELNYTAGYFQIVKRPITIRLEDQIIPYSFKTEVDNGAYIIESGSIVNNDDLNLTLYANVNILRFTGTYIIYADSDNENYEINIITGTLEVVFSLTAFAVIAIPVCIFVGGGIAFYLIRRKFKFKRFLKDDNDLF